jgi:hypothetical protein
MLKDLFYRNSNERGRCSEHNFDAFIMEELAHECGLMNGGVVKKNDTCLSPMRIEFV